MRNLHSSLLPVLLLIVASLAGCAAPVSQSAPSPTPAQIALETEPAEDTELARLKISVAPFIANTAFYIAYEEGFFAEEGVEIEIAQMTRSLDAIPALAAGDIDVMTINVTAALLNIMVRDSNIRIVGPLAQTAAHECVYSGLMIRHGTVADEAQEITPEILQSLVFNITPTAISAMVIDRLLNHYGLTQDDIEMVDLPGQAATFDPLVAGAIDVTIASEPWVTRIRATEAADVWEAQNEFQPNVQASVIAFGPSILENNPELGERFMVAYLRGVHQLAEGKTARNLDILEQHLELERELLAEVCLPHVPGDGSILLDSVEEFSAWLAEKDYVDTPLTADQFWEPRFVEHANQILGTR